MRKFWMRRSVVITLLTCGLVIAAAFAQTETQTRVSGANGQAEASRVAVGADGIGGVVTSPNGPEAGVWVIAETMNLPTRFRKIVVTDDRGRYLLPQLPKANYKVWVRGYGLVDSELVAATPGKPLALTAVLASDSRAAAQFYPANYWYSLAQVPPKSAFPMSLPPAPPGAPSFFGPPPTEVPMQATWIDTMKSACEVCHQMGNKATREIEPSLGVFATSVEAWDHRLRMGQVPSTSFGGLSSIGRDRGVAMFADWTDRIAKGEVPPAPPRPQGVERNLVITLWDYSVPVAFLHDVISTNKLNPTENAYGPVYGAEWSQGALEVVDPATNERSEIKLPLRDENERKRLRTWSQQSVAMPSPYWGDQIIWNDPINAHTPQIDRMGRVWVNVTNHGPNSPAYCKAGSGNPFAKAYPIESSDGWGVDVYDPKTAKLELIDLCFRTQHTIVAGDKDETLYFSIPVGTGGIGWIKTRVWDQTHDAEKAQGWCAPVIDYNGDGRTGPYTKGNEPPDPKLDRAVSAAGGYGAAVSPVDGSIWYAAPGPPLPGKIIRIVPGASPPSTCMTEAYEPPFNNPQAQGELGYTPRGIDIDTNGVVWTALAGSGHLASFDRRKCKVLNGPTATGQHCPEGWALYQPPGPKFKGETDAITDWFYLNWTDRYGVLGLGKNVQVVNGTGSDSLLVFEPSTKNWITLRVPYPMGFYTRGLDGRIDDPKAGWKGRGLWTSNETRVIWHTEGGKGTTSQMAHFQIRTDPLAH
jgi:hypothetical protein